jgi:hypothetical protein
MVSCAFATTGTIEMANVKLINPHLMEVVLDVGSTRILKMAAATNDPCQKAMTISI